MLLKSGQNLKCFISKMPYFFQEEKRPISAAKKKEKAKTS
jgi:hypothetical protein